MGHGAGWGDREYFPGAYGAYAFAWGAHSFVLPDSVSDAEAAMMDILAVAVHAARRGEIRSGDRVLVMGLGPAGNAVAQVARASGAVPIGVDSLETPRQVAKACGLADVRESISECEGEVFDVVIDSVGTPEVTELGLKRLAPRGRLVSLAVHVEAMTLTPTLLGAERTWTTSCNFERKDFETGLEMLARGDLVLQPWFMPIELRQVPDVFADPIGMRRGRSGIKWLILPS
jgi:threonine dehydrogenase-like Zn-dependent dehydrogenase